MIRQIVQFSSRPRGAPPDDVRGGLRHRRRPHAVPGLRRVAEQPPPSAGGVRHVAARRRRSTASLQLLDPRRLVGRDVRRRERLGHLVGRGLRGHEAPRRRRGGDAVRHPRAPDRARSFYDRFEGPVPRRWVRRIKSSLRSLGPQVVASRMVRDYVEQLYEPTAAQADALTADSHGQGPRAGGVEAAGDRPGGTACGSCTVESDVRGRRPRHRAPRRRRR